MYAIVDCKNFYASCERLFNPKLAHKPIVVLSNNDGCVIARSDEAKVLGIKMGAPAFEIKELVNWCQVCVFSSNYTLYGDMSRRVMDVLRTFCTDMEVYSIDEAFLSLFNMPYTDICSYVADIRQVVTQYTGIPVGIGVGPTKTLAKAANKYAKKVHGDKGVFVVDTEEKRIEVLKWLPVEDVWGIGHRYAKRMRHYNINTAYDLSLCNDAFIRYGDPHVKDETGKQFFRGMGVVGVRLVKELQGISCLPLECIQPTKKNICTSRSFASDLTDIEDIRQAVATHTTRCAEKLRKDHTCAGLVTVFLHTNTFKQVTQYHPCIPIKMDIATNSTAEILKYAMAGLEAIYRKGYGYKKAGVIVSEIVPQAQVQNNLFRVPDIPRDTKLMRALDGINDTMGQDTVRYATAGYGKRWRLRNEYKSPCYTTNLMEAITVKL